ncbi:MAG: endolytic transglycosylase MltG [Acidimicrobiales bacterium]|nr:endolytic transglycosylase MltG [Acidimicrobiales bacterium]
MTDHGPTPGDDGRDPFLDPDIWSDEPEVAVGAARRGPRRPGRPPERGPARPPRPARAPRPVVEEEDEYFDLPPHSRAPRWLVVLLVLVGLVAVGVLGGRWWYGNQVDPPGAPGEEIAIQIAEGTSAKGVASVLADEGVITNASLFNLWVSGKDLDTIQAGAYRFRSDMSFQEAVDVLNAGPDTPIAAETTKVTIPEGYTVAQIVARISEKVPRLAAADLQAALDEGKVPTSLLPAGTTDYEGLLFPATYEVGDDDDAVDVLTMMAQEMETRVEALGIDDAIAHVQRQWGLDLTAYDMVKVASMIQYEAAVPEDAPKIGAVTYNRLEQGMPLQYDSTSIYEAALRGLTPAEVDYTADNPYNTRTRTGLPPTPIAAPGEYALVGAFQPSDGPWLYFVLTDTKVVSFTDSYDEFLEFKQQCIAKDLGCG